MILFASNKDVRGKVPLGANKAKRRIENKCLTIMYYNDE